MAVSKPVTPAMCGVPASKRIGGGAYVVPSKLTFSIMEPPPS